MLLAVVGLGYVGLPLAVAFSKHYTVIGFDINEKKIQELSVGVDKMGEAKPEELMNSKLIFTSDARRLKDADFISVAVPTPVLKSKMPDFSYLESSSRIIGENLKKNAVVAFESTVYPGATEEICVPVLEKYSGMKCGVDFKIAYSPERINPGDKEHSVEKIVKVVSGMDAETLEKAAEVYGKISPIYRASSIKVAEAAKVIENTQRDLNIALVNELSLIFHKLGIDTKEVLQAAGTKWNFHKYVPGLVGGHCFDANQVIFLNNSGHNKTEKIGEYFEKVSEKFGSQDGLVYPKGVKMLSFDVDKRKSKMSNVLCFSKRKYKNLLKITTQTNQEVVVTDLHPMLIYEDGEFKVKHAKDLDYHDKLPILLDLPLVPFNKVIDILDHLPNEFIRKVRVKPKNGSFKSYKNQLNLRKINGKKPNNYYVWNYLPLELYLELEKKDRMPLSRDDILLATGRGPSFSVLPAKIKIDEDFLRLLGYYLSEGCVTSDKSLRVRFAFNRGEKEFINDVKAIITKLHLRYSIYQPKKDYCTQIKVSSNLFGFLIKDILKCGTNCYNMQIPQEFLFSDKNSQKALLSGILRGDGGVHYENRLREYSKNNKKYTHYFNAASINYFSSSTKLFNQVQLLLLGLGCTYSLDLKRPLLTIHGHKNLQKLKDLFIGDKREKLDNYFKNKRKFIESKNYSCYDTFATVGIKNIASIDSDDVYSVEVEGTNTLVTQSGIITHNCISVDPYYLTYKAEAAGYYPKVILSGREVNDYMPKHLANLVVHGLNEAGKVLKDCSVLVMGLTFKENVADIRNSKIADLISELKLYGITVLGCDPLLDAETVMKHFGIENHDPENLPGKFDCVVFAQPHQVFHPLTLDSLMGMMTGNPLLIDVKGFFEKEKALALGISYRRL